MDKIRIDFNRYRSLDQVKILCSGPLATGKTLMSSKLSKHYNVPLIQVQQTIEEWLVQEYDPKGQDPDADPYAEQREVVAKWREDCETFKQTVLGLKRKGQKSTLEKPKLSDDILILAYKWKLQQNACFNRGFILDNFPKTYKQCQDLFMKKKKPANEDDEEKVEMELDTELMPEKLVILSGNESNILKRTKQLQNEK
mmetsp:Transcript_63243/g.136897  ORF Transcript_63243/g.136897 Transcript_63243/m.136897 type:complete len:198 (+) Transcript_63243:1174-1767(+)